MAVYFTDRGIKELGERRGEQQVTLGRPAPGLRRPAPRLRRAGRLATLLARVGDEDCEA